MTHQHEVLPLESVGTADGNRERDNQPASDAAGAPARDPEGLTHGSEALADQAFEDWKSIQGKFVDDPRGSVADARALVDDVIKGVVHSLTAQRESLDQQWCSEPSVSTEQLRLCLQQYRALFTRILPVIPSTHVESSGPKR